MEKFASHHIRSYPLPRWVTNYKGIRVSLFYSCLKGGGFILWEGVENGKLFVFEITPMKRN